MDLISWIKARTSFNSASSFSISNPVSLASRMLRIASACRSLSLNRLCNCRLAVGVSSAARISLITASMLSTAIFKPFEDVLPLQRPVEFELRAASDDGVTVTDVMLQNVPQREHSRHELLRRRIGDEGPT